MFPWTNPMMLGIFGDFRSPIRLWLVWKLPGNTQIEVFAWNGHFVGKPNFQTSPISWRYLIFWRIKKCWLWIETEKRWWLLRLAILWMTICSHRRKSRIQKTARWDFDAFWSHAEPSSWLRLGHVCVYCCTKLYIWRLFTRFFFGFPHAPKSTWFELPLFLLATKNRRRTVVEPLSEVCSDSASRFSTR